MFISYTRVDRPWVDRLQQMMVPMLRNSDQELRLWDDSQIEPGQKWREAIETALNEAKVALLLVSDAFLASEFVMHEEVPALLAAAKAEGVRILWVSLSPCLVEQTPIHAYQAVLPPERCLAEMGEVEQQRALRRIAHELQRALLAGTEQQRRFAEQARQRSLEQQEQEQQRQEQARQAEAAERARVQAQRQAEAEQRRLDQQAAARQRLLEQRRRQERWQGPAAPLGQEPGTGGSRLSRRQLLRGAAGLPLVAAGAAGLRALQHRQLPGPFPFTTSVGRLQRRGDAWQVLTSPIQVAMDREPLAPGLELRLIEIPAGSFTMGSPPGEPDRSDDEGPRHQVRLQRFLMGQTPITQAQWREVASWPRVAKGLNPDPSRFEGDYFKGDNRPVERVSWFDAMEFCRRLSERTGRRYSLPSEAQWEYACRAGTTTPFHCGETITTDLANYHGNYSYAKGPKGKNRAETTSVDMFPANAWGLKDMHGNVQEWCLDHWHGGYAGAPSNGTAWLDDEWPLMARFSQKERLLRGGSWLNLPRVCRSAHRDHDQPGNAYLSVGFRVVCLPQGPSLNYIIP